LGKGRKKRVSKAEWLEAALRALEDHGIEGVKVERLARDLGIAKSGFYWHFRDRDDLLDALLHYWSLEFTGVVAKNPQVTSLPPHDRLRTTMEMVFEHGLGRYDAAFAAWARVDRRANRVYRQVYRNRLKFVGQAFQDLGFEGDELEMRRCLFVVHESWQAVAFPDLAPSKARRLIERRLDLYTRPGGSKA
jgi:AcrR family transcriptional regulator